MSEMNRQAAPLLKIEGGSFAYKGGPQILKDINIEVEPGEILAHTGIHALEEDGVRASGRDGGDFVYGFPDRAHWKEQPNRSFLLAD